MTLFQMIAAPVAGVLALRSAIQLVRGMRPRWWPLASTAIWLGAGIAILWPTLTTRVARLLGIGRGADLVIYVVTILFIGSLFYLLQRFRRVESELTQLVRMLALRDAETATDPGNTPPLPPDPPAAS